MLLDALIICAHPDDAELGMGGTIAKMTHNNLKVGIIDLTRGELGTRGTAESRQQEAFQAAIILKLALRENLHIPDGDIQVSKENIMSLIVAIRRYKPKLLFAPYRNDRHPDHVSTSQLVKKAWFYSGLSKVKTFDKESAQQAFRPQNVFYFMQSYDFKPTFIVDVTEYFDTKMKAVNAFGTQFFNPDSKEPETFISQPGFLTLLEARAQHYGFLIRKKYGEPFFCEEYPELDLNGYTNHLTRERCV